jgi:cytosine/adenosine deaminase-related metal-dependent hydrolase
VGARAVSGRDTCGRIEPGLDADLLFLDYEALAADVLPGLMDESLLVLGRASARFIRHLMVSGRWVLRDGQLTGIDERAVLEELRRQAESSVATLQHRQPLLQRYQARLRDFYHRGLHRGGG